MTESSVTSPSSDASSSSTTRGADAVVLGHGLAGLVAAVELLEAGRRVVLVDQERAADLGGQRAGRDLRGRVGGEHFLGFAWLGHRDRRDDPEREQEGRADQAKSDLKSAGEKVKDAFER